MVDGGSCLKHMLRKPQRDFSRCPPYPTTLGFHSDKLLVHSLIVLTALGGTGLVSPMIRLFLLLGFRFDRSIPVILHALHLLEFPNLVFSLIFDTFGVNQQRLPG
jgi:hypothetical protein